MLRTASLPTLTYGDPANTYENVEVHVSQYFNGGTAVFMTADGEPLGKVSVYLDGATPASDCIWVKTWSENTGLMEALIAEGLLEATGRTMNSGFATAKECRLAGALA